MPSVQVVGLDHVVLRCADIEVSLAFYCDEPGLAPDRVDEWRRGWRRVSTCTIPTGTSSS